MKQIVVFLASILMVFVVQAQNQQQREIPENAPTFNSDKYESVNNMFNEIWQLKTEEVVGKVVVEFVVTKEGELKDYKIKEGISPCINEDVIAALKKTNGHWAPGTENGSPVDMLKEVSIVFQCQLTCNTINKANCYLCRGCKMLYKKNNTKRALRNFEKGLVLLPNDKTLLAMREKCFSQLAYLD